MNTDKTNCPVCDAVADRTMQYDAKELLNFLTCPRCGNFVIHQFTADQIPSWTERQKINLAGWLRENPGFEITSSNLKTLGELRDLTVGEKAEKLLGYFVDKYPNPGEKIKIGQNNTLELQAISRASDREELDFLIQEYLVKSMGFVIFLHAQGNAPSDAVYIYQISPSGWAHIDSKRQANPNSQIGFIAMWFSESVNDAWLAIDRGISAAGYKPFRVDQKQHNNKIDDEIIAGIRGSKFLVADLTDHRGGVYYEAGFAQGLGLEVIWLCRRSDLEKMHFDIRQYNCIVWEDEKLDELTKALKVRIEARFGHGSINEVAGP